jgi:predicted TIM-barrel fold metal-dependent hydrolase
MGKMRRTSRREFLAYSTIGASRVLGQTSNYTVKPHLIDVHHHILPPDYLAETRDRIVAQGQGVIPASVLHWTPQTALEEMEQNGVATAIVSISTPGIWFGDVQAARSLARKCNEYSARLVKDYPGRFGFFAAIPLPDAEGSLKEIAFALEELRADGIGLMTSYGDKWPGDPAYAPVFEELNRRKALVYVHPNAPNCCRDLMSYVPNQVIELSHDTTRSVTSLLFSGALSRFPNIRFVFSHAGGTVPMVAARLARQGNSRKDVAARLPNGVEYELRKLYYEIAGSANRPAMAALRAFVPASQILFGSDYPWLPIRTTAGEMTELGLSGAEMRAIGRDNAAALLPRLRA